MSLYLYVYKAFLYPYFFNNLIYSYSHAIFCICKFSVPLFCVYNVYASIFLKMCIYIYVLCMSKNAFLCSPLNLTEILRSEEVNVTRFPTTNHKDPAPAL